jgi:hypothetical protein
LQVGCLCFNEPSYFTDVCVIQSCVDLIQYEERSWLIAWKLKEYKYKELITLLM